MQDDLVIRAAIRDELSAPLAGIRQEIKATGEQAEKAGRKANVGARGFDAMAGGVGRMVKATGRAAVLGLGALTAAIGAVTIGAATMGIKTAAEMQNASVAFTTMLGSGKKAAAFLTKLKAFAASTPFEFPELQDAASSLISAGINADKVIPIMTTLGNVTSGMGTGAEGVQRATIAIQQMTAAGKIAGEDLNQLRDAGIPVYDLLAKATGKSKAEVVKLAQAGKLGKKELDQMMSALESGKGMERFAGLMDKQSKTLGGVWSTLSDTVNMGLAGALEPAIPVLTDLVLKASDLASGTIFPAITKFLQNLVTFAPQAWDALKSGDLSMVAHSLDGITGSGGSLFEKFQQLKPSLDAVLAILKTFGPDLADATNPAKAFTDQLGLTDDVLKFAGDHANLVHDGIIAVGAAMTIGKAATVAMGIATGAKNAIDAVSLVILKAQTPGTLAYAAAQGVVTVATGAWTAATWLLNGAIAVLTSPIGLVVLAIAALAAGFVLAWKHSQTFRNIVTGALDGIITGIDKFLGAISYMLRALSHMPGFGWAKGAADAVDRLGNKVRGLHDDIANLRDKSVTISVTTVKSQIIKNNDRLAENGISGDTATSHARGRGGLASTLATHSALSSGQTITNALVGGGGRGHGSGDHQAGRALDLTGPGLPGYATKLRAAGGFAQMHGAGPARHLHAVYPAGDTARSMTPRVASSRSGGSGPAAPVVIGAGAIVVTNPTSDVDIERAVAAGIRRHLRDAQERA